MAYGNSPIKGGSFSSDNPNLTDRNKGRTVSVNGKVFTHGVSYTQDDTLIIPLQDTKPPDKISEFDTGAIRSSDENKTLWDLIPVECLERVAIKYTDGAKIYGKHNWRKGIPTERYIGGALRHFMQWQLGKRDEDHLAAVVFNIFGMMFNELQDKQYPYGGKDGEK